MKTKLQNWRNKDTSLVIDNQAARAADRIVLARMTIQDGTGCWTVCDLRLSPYRAPSPYLHVSADTIHARVKPETPEDAAFVRSQLREFVESPDGEIRWCSYDGIVRGRRAEEVVGYRHEWAQHDHPIFFTKKEAEEQLHQIAAYWAAFEGDLAAVGSIKLASEYRQPSMSSIQTRLIIRQMDRERSVLPKSAESGVAPAAPSHDIISADLSAEEPVPPVERVRT